MNLAIIGRTEMLYDTAEVLNKNGHKIKVVITAKEAPEYKKTAKDFKKLALKLGAKYLYTSAINNRKNIDFIEKSGPLDIGVSSNYVNIISSKVINLFSYGILNAHMGDLPNYRGNACPNWAIINGEKEITISIHLIEGEKLDCGRVIVQAKLPISEDTYIGDIYRWAQDAVPRLFLKAASLLKDNPNYTLKYADENSVNALRCYPRRPEDSRIYWNLSAEEIHRLIRASSRPFSGAYCFLDGRKMIVWKADKYFDNEKYLAIPGQICAIEKDYFVVITGNGKLKITRWQCSEKIISIRQRMS